MHLDVVWFLPHHVISVTVQQHTSQDVMGEAEDTIPPISHSTDPPPVSQPVVTALMPVVVTRASRVSAR